jgi:hypothetical protein
MKAPITAALLILLLGLTSQGVRAAGGFAHSPLTLTSGLDMSRATIPVDVDGRRYACVLDTGTSAMLVSQSVAQAVGLTPEARIDEVSPDGLHYADEHTHLARFTVAGYTMRDVPALISSKLGGDKVLCGYDFFAEIPTLIDRDRQIVTLFPVIATLDRMRCLPIDLTPRVPLATLRVNGAWVDRIVLDSGMVGGGAIWNDVVKDLPQALFGTSAYRTDPRNLQTGLSCGFGATIGLFDGLPSNAIPLCTSSQPPDGYNGIVETNLPNVHALAVDYPNRRLCFNL